MRRDQLLRAYSCPNGAAILALPGSLPKKDRSYADERAEKKRRKNGGGGGENKKGTTDQQPPESIPPSYLALPSRTRSLLGFTEFSSIVSTCSLLVDRVKEKNDPKSHQTDFQLVLPGFSKQRTDETKNKETRAQKKKRRDKERKRCPRCLASDGQ